MKKLFAAVVTFAFICVFFCLSASAATLDGDAQRSAEMLKELNLFRGTDKGFELDREMTRAEAAAMLVRFLGAEDAAMNGEFSHPFTDVPEWADNYVGWLYTSGLTKGVSSTLYGSQQPVSAWQYAMFITRALRNDEVIPSELITEDEITAIDSEKKFLRGDAAIMSLRALDCNYNKYGNHVRKFVFACIERKMFTYDEVDSAISGNRDLFTPHCDVRDGGFIVSSILDGLYYVAESSEGGYSTFHGSPTIAVGIPERDPFIFRRDGETVTIYTIDVETLETTEITKREGIREDLLYGDFYYQEAFILGDTRFIFESLFDEDKHTLLAVKNGEAREVLSFIETGEYDWYLDNQSLWLDNNSAIFCANKRCFYVTENDYSEIGQANLVPLAYIDGSVIAQRINDTSIDVLQIAASTGEVKVSYNVPDDIERGGYGEGYRGIMDPDWYGTEENFFCGEGGLYFFNGENLVQITNRPANDFFKTDDGGYVILTHKPGKRFYGQVYLGGNEIMKIGADGSETYLTREDTPFSMDVIFLKDNKVHFTTATGVGMMNFDVFTYRIEDNGKLTVTDFDAGRPEVMDGFTWDDPDGYKPGYIEAEQKRIEELGY